jgi:hypothetical protein
LDPIGFLEGLKRLEIFDFNELEIACLMRVLSKPNLDNAVVLSELIIIMENFGIKEKDDPS